MLDVLQAFQGSVSATHLHAFLRPNGTLSRQQARERGDIRQHYSDKWIDVLRQVYKGTEDTLKKMDEIISDYQGGQPSTSSLSPAFMQASFMRTEAVLEASRACRTRSAVPRALDDWLDDMEELDRQFEPPLAGYSYSAPTASPSGRSFDGLDELDIQIVPFGRDASSAGDAGTSSSARPGHYRAR